MLTDTATLEYSDSLVTDSPACSRSDIICVNSVTLESVSLTLSLTACIVSVTDTLF
jgi:hypothetical protein